MLAAGSLLDAEKRVAVRHVQGATARQPVSVPAASGPRVVHAEVEIATRILQGHISTALADASRDADLLVLGTPSGEDRQRAFAGSLALRVTSAAECSAVAVPHGWDGPGAGFVVGVDGERPAELAVEFAAAEAAASGEELTVVCAGYAANPLLAGLVPERSLGDHREHIVAAATELARELRPGLAVRGAVVEDAPARGLVTRAAGARMLVLGTRGRRGAKRVMLGSVGHDVLLNLRCPVAIVRAPAA
jgi:nucleotide-binding universal stress UspA family protein